MPQPAFPRAGGILRINGGSYTRGILSGSKVLRSNGRLTHPLDQLHDVHSNLLLAAAHRLLPAAGAQEELDRAPIGGDVLGAVEHDDVATLLPKLALGLSPGVDV